MADWFGMEGGILGGGGADRSQRTTQTSTQSSDMRTAVEGNVSQLISPGAAVATPGGGAVNAAAGSMVSQSIVNEGMTAEDVNTLFDMVQQDRYSERAATSSLGVNMAAGIQAQSAQIADILAATKAPDSTTLTTLLPLLVLLALLYFLTR